MHSSDTYNSVKNRLIEIWKREHPPLLNEYLDVLKKVNIVLISEDKKTRPRDKSDLPGGLIYLKKNTHTIIVPDIHARMDFFLNIMLDKDSKDKTNLQKIESDELQIICVGDGFHAEKRAAKRWAQAYKEFEQDYTIHKNIDEEMRESLGVMEMVMEVKSNYPLNFHFIKGNHENIKNEEGGGNYPFMKFSYEGPMVAYYIEKFYGKEFLEEYYKFEKNLPLFAVGKNFLISHAEPLSFFDEEKIIEYRNNPDVIEGLTWTADDAANDGSVQEMLSYYIRDEDNAGNKFYFGGHRPVKNLFNPRADGQYIQIHNPDKFIIASIGTGVIDLQKDIHEIENNINKIIEDN